MELCKVITCNWVGIGIVPTSAGLFHISKAGESLVSPLLEFGIVHHGRLLHSCCLLCHTHGPLTHSHSSLGHSHHALLLHGHSHVALVHSYHTSLVHSHHALSHSHVALLHSHSSLIHSHVTLCCIPMVPGCIPMVPCCIPMVPCPIAMLPCIPVPTKDSKRKCKNVHTAAVERGWGWHANLLDVHFPSAGLCFIASDPHCRSMGPFHYAHTHDCVNCMMITGFHTFPHDWNTPLQFYNQCSAPIATVYNSLLTYPWVAAAGSWTSVTSLCWCSASHFPDPVMPASATDSWREQHSSGIYWLGWGCPGWCQHCHCWTRYWGPAARWHSTQNTCISSGKENRFSWANYTYHKVMETISFFSTIKACEWKWFVSRSKGSLLGTGLLPPVWYAYSQRCNQNKCNRGKGTHSKMNIQAIALLQSAGNLGKKFKRYYCSLETYLRGSFWCCSWGGTGGRATSASTTDYIRSWQGLQ